MLLGLLPLVATSVAHPDATVVTTSVPAAQVRLADLLGSADSIDAVRAHSHTVTFLIERADARGNETPFEIVATTSDHGLVIDVSMHERAATGLELGGLSWLAETMSETTAVTNLDVDEDGAVTLTTADGERYMAIPGRGSGGDADDRDADGNIDVEARWAAEFDSDPQS